MENQEIEAPKKKEVKDDAKESERAEDIAS